MKKNLIKIFSCTMILCLIITASGCSNDISSAEKAVNTVLSSLKKGDFEKVSANIIIEDKEESEQDDEQSAQLVKLFEKLEYSILSSEQIDSGNVNVSAKVTSLNFKSVMADYFQKALAYAFQNAFADPQPTEEETNKKMEEILVECINAEDVELVTTEVIIKVVKDGSSWKVKSDDNFANAILGGITDLEEAFGGMSEE